MKYAFINGIILDGTETMRPQSGMVIFTDGETITAVSPAGASLDGYEVIDLHGGYILPGLINMHAHLPASGKPVKGKLDYKMLVQLVLSNPVTKKLGYILTQNNAKKELMSGVTTLRAVGGLIDCDSTTRDRIAAGELDGPRIVCSNLAITVPDGHMEGSVAVPVHSAEEAVEKLREIAATKPDFIKLMITGGVLDAKVRGEPGELKMPPEYVKAACDEAHKLGYIVAAHVESPIGVKVALENGVDSIEHGAEPTEEIIELFKKRGAFLTATLSPALPCAEFDRSVTRASEDDQYNGQVIFRGMIRCIKACLANGIPVALGTDTGCPFTTQYDMWRELYWFVKYIGVTPAFAIHSATAGNARLLGLGDTLGTIEAGKCADMIVCEKDPLTDLTTLRSLRMVVARGRVYRDPKVRKMPAVERELDKFL